MGGLDAVSELDQEVVRRIPARVARGAAGGAPCPRRIVLYSHDTMGLGHTRRNLLIVEQLLRADPSRRVLLVGGARETGAFPLPPGADSLLLPALRKDESGAYGSRSLGLGLEALIALRAATIRSAVGAFDPDLVIVDQVPRGALGELDGTLQDLRCGGRARVILGLRDVLDEPRAVRAQWRAARNVWALRAFYDEAWVYGDPGVHDPVRELRWPADLAARVHHLGYLDPRARAECPGADRWAASLAADGPLMLCLLGGGQDGASVASAFVDAQLPAGATGVIVTGPFFPAAELVQLCRRAQSRARMRVVKFTNDPGPLVRRAERIVAMGGYNTMCEVLAYQRTALVVPRVRPRREQWIRARSLERLGWVETADPDGLGPARISEWLARPSVEVGPETRHLDFGGLERLCERVDFALHAQPALCTAVGQARHAVL